MSRQGAVRADAPLFPPVNTGIDPYQYTLIGKE